LNIYTHEAAELIRWKMSHDNLVELIALSALGLGLDRSAPL
jgi:hypothetical protein